MSEHTQQSCGCFVATDAFHEPTIEWCPLHEAAPELLEALDSVLRVASFDHRGRSHDAYMKAITAIAKVVGKTHVIDSRVKASSQESEVGE